MYGGERPSAIHLSTANDADLAASANDWGPKDKIQARRIKLSCQVGCCSRRSAESNNHFTETMALQRSSQSAAMMQAGSLRPFLVLVR
jgi:hypothetical protein